MLMKVRSQCSETTLLYDLELMMRHNFEGATSSSYSEWFGVLYVKAQRPAQQSMFKMVVMCCDCRVHTRRNAAGQSSVDYDCLPKHLPANALLHFGIA